MELFVKRPVITINEENQTSCMNLDKAFSIEQIYIIFISSIWSKQDHKSDKHIHNKQQ